MPEFAKSDILSALDIADMESEDGPRWGYSGRGMYGRTCFGFVGNMQDYSNFLLALVEVFFDQTEDIDQSKYLASLFGERVATDSMGYDTIFYFPGIQVLDKE